MTTKEYLPLDELIEEMRHHFFYVEFKKSNPNGHTTPKPTPQPKGPSKWVRDEFIRKVKEITKKSPQPKKPGA